LLITCSTSAVAVCRSSASFVSLKHTHVLDRDHRLIGEGLRERDFLGRKLAGLSAQDQQAAHGLAFAQQRHPQAGSPAPP